MRRKGTALALAGLGALWLAGSPASTGDRTDDIRRTTDPMLREGAEGPADVHTTLRHLLEIAGDLGREARLPAPTQAKLDAAVAEARRLSPLDGAVRAKVAEAARPSTRADPSSSRRRSGASSRRRPTVGGRWTAASPPCPPDDRGRRPGSWWASSSW